MRSALKFYIVILIGNNTNLCGVEVKALKWNTTLEIKTSAYLNSRGISVRAYILQ